MARFRDGTLAITFAGSLMFCRAAPHDVLPARLPLPIATRSAPASVDAGSPGPTTTVPEDVTRFSAIDGIVAAAIDASKMPGCVVTVGRSTGVVFEKAYGARAVLPERVQMTTDTVFDLASLTKPVATASSLMVLVDRGDVDLDARASTYVPELQRLPPFTVRHLLLHTSGLPAVTPMADWTPDHTEVMRRIGALALRVLPGEHFLYSDVGYVVLQEIVERVGKKSLARFSADEVFAPLGMSETGFLPRAELRARAAPTEMRAGVFMQGDVHDPRAFALGGVAGNAGVFSTAKDLSRFARVMLQKGATGATTSLFSETTFDSFLARHETSKGGRALGWDVDSSFATHRSALLSRRAFGHGGYTGTALWIDPEKDLFVLFLSNRVHPDGKGAVNPVVLEIASLAIDALAVRTGIDVLRAESFERLRGARVGLVTNGSAKARDGVPTADLLRAAPGVSLGAIFTPEHGMTADREGSITDASYAGVPLYSLYGEHLTPTQAMLTGLDTIVLDLQDVGVRFYTYAPTMKRVMRAAADQRLRFVVLDRPNPIDGVAVQGPVLESQNATQGLVSPLPVRHGMTMGELAKLFVAEERLVLALDVVRMKNWRRSDTYERTGLVWSAPSPNLRDVRAVTLYPALGLLESTNVSVGRGTDTPFEVVAAPWLDGPALVRKLQAANVAGVTFEPTELTPTVAPHAQKRCRGVRVRVTKPTSFEPVRTALAIATALRELHPNEWTFDTMDRMLRSPAAMAALRNGSGIADVEATWASELAAFKTHREPYLLYP